MALDKELYRKMLEAYREWNEFELVDRARNAGMLSPKEAWQQYVDLWEFAVNSAPPQSDLRLNLRLQEWEEYYAKIQKFEAWRRTRAQKNSRHLCVKPSKLWRTMATAMPLSTGLRSRNGGW